MDRKEMIERLDKGQTIICVDAHEHFNKRYTASARFREGKVAISQEDVTELFHKKLIVQTKFDHMTFLYKRSELKLCEVCGGGISESIAIVDKKKVKTFSCDCGIGQERTPVEEPKDDSDDDTEDDGGADFLDD